MNDALREAETSCLEVLKARTLSLHKTLEKQLSFPESFVTQQSFMRVLIVFHSFQIMLNHYAHIYAHQVDTAFRLESRQRLPLIIRDMETLGIAPATAIDHEPLRLNSLAEFYGALYVNEGSTMGGHIIQAAMVKMHGEQARDWTRYLNPYGSELMPMWQSFRDVLEEKIESGAVCLEDVITGASKTFQFLLSTAEKQGFDGTS